MVNEGWTLNDFIAFANEYELTYIIIDSNETTIPSSEYDKYKDAIIIDQSRKAGDRILSNVTQKITLNVVYEPDENNDENNNETSDE